MALNAATVWEVRTTGADTNGGGFNATRDAINGVDYSQQNAAQLSLTDLACASNTTLTSVTGGFTHAMEGNLIYIASGTNAAIGYYEIVTYTDTNTVTIDRTCASGGDMSAGVGKVGGALASPGMAASGMVANNKMWIKAGTYSITSATQNISGGKVVLSSGTAPMHMEGYQTTRGDRGTKPLLQASGISSCSILTINGRFCIADNISVDGAGLASMRGIENNSTYYNTLIRCSALNCTNYGIVWGGSGVAFGCTASGCATQPAFYGDKFVCCEAYNNTVTGISLFTGGSAINCLSYDNTGASTYQFDGSGSSALFWNCSAHGGGAGAGGFKLANAAVCINCHAEANSGYGFYIAAATVFCRLINCSGYDNSSGNYDATKITEVQNFVAVTVGSVYTDAANHDFSLNSTANQGALLRGAGTPGLYPRGLTTGYPDIGAAQHQDAGGGGMGGIFESVVR